MKKTFTLLAASLLFAAALSATIQPVVISEVFYDTPLEEDMWHNQIHHNGEFIELYNPTTDDIDISGWYITDNGFYLNTTFTFPQNTIIHSKTVIIVAFRQQASAFELKDLFPDMPSNTRIFYQSKMWLKNAGDMVNLHNKSRQVVDLMSYRKRNNNRADLWNIYAQNGRISANLRSIQRKQVSCTSSSISFSKNDYFTATATPGLANINLLSQTVESVLYPAGEVNTTLPVGTIQGAASVSPTGAAAYQIPIEIPAGTNGFQPQISIAYSSQGGFGALGIGWDIGGLSSISRGLQNFYFDEKSDGTIDAATIKFNDTDQLYIDGQRLILLTGTHFQAGAVYGSETENYARVTIKTSPETQKIYFELTTKEGNVTEYGKTENSLLKDGNKVLAWKINKQKDVYENEINYTYQDNGQYLTEITYGNNEIKFFYNNDILARKQCINGFWLIQDKVLNYISSQNTTENLGEEIRTNYYFRYLTENQNIKLESIEHTVYTNKNKSEYAFNKTKITWGQESEITEVTLDKMPDGNLNNVNNSAIYAGDIDGDGYSDKIEVKKGLFETQTYGYIRVILKNNQTLLTQLSPNYYLDRMLIADFDNDGKDEIVLFSKYHFIRVYKITNDNTALTSYQYAFPLSFNRPFVHSSDNFSYIPIVTNINNDAYLDIVLYPYITKSSFSGDYIKDDTGQKLTTVEARIYYGSANGLLLADEYAESYTIPVSSLKGSYFVPFLGNFNADDKLDILNITSASNTTTHSLLNIDISENTKWNHGVLGFRNSGASISGTISRRFESAYPFDIDNDGFTDILFKLDESLGYKWWLKRNNGGYNVIPTDNNNKSYYHNITNDYSRENTNKDERDFTVVIDYNGDGYQDIIIADDIYDGEEFKGSDWHFYKNIGGDLQYELKKHKTEAVSKLNPVIMDINNDGIPDLVFGDGQGDRNNRYYHAFTMPAANKRNVVHSITNGMGQTEKFDYKYFSNYNQTENRSDLRDLKSPMMTVDKYTATDGSTTSYTYEKPKIHTRGRGFLGFERITVTDNLTKQKTVSEYEIDTVYYITNLKKQTVSINGTEISETVNTNAVKSAQITQGANAEKRFIPVLTKQTTTDKLRNFTSVTDYEYNDYGFLTKQKTVAGDITTITEYADFKKRTSNGLVAYLPQTKTAKTERAGQQQKFEFVSNYTYTDKGDIETSTELVGTYAETVTAYEYYPTGNLHKVKVKPAEKTEWQITTYGYDSLFRFAESKTNTLNQTSGSTHDVYGRLLTETDIYGLVTSYEYNALGQLVKKTLPTGEEISYATAWGANGGTYRFKKTVTSNKTSAVSETHYDGAGREIYSHTSGWNGALLKSFTEYDPATLKVKRAVKPRYDGETEVYTQYEYNDPFFRVSKEKVFDGSNLLVTSYAYDDQNGKVTTTPPAGADFKTTSAKNALGETVTRSDAGGTITYTYNALGKPVTIETGGAVTTIEYDEVGRQWKLHDPNAGTITYEYYADGSLKKHTSATGDITEYLYDRAGRDSIKTVKDYDEGVLISTTETKYTYVAGGNGKGQIQSITLKENGAVVHSQTVSYNNKHLTEYLTDTYEGTNYVFHYTYDNLWRPDETTSPSGLTTKNVYNAYGDLYQIKKGNNIIWQGNEQNSNGQWKKYTLGNGLETNTVYSPRGEILNIQTRKPNQNAYIQNLAYGYESATGNLTLRQDLKNSRIETFEYDNLDRLKTATLNNNLLFDIDYGNNGNINYKDDVGDYIYDHPAKPNAMTGIDNAQQGINTDIKQFIDYTPFNKIKFVAQGFDRTDIQDSYEIFYGLDRQRIKTIYTNENGETATRYYFGTYEKDIKTDGSIEETDYICTPAGLTAIIRNAAEVFFVHTDRQGSIQAITDNSGNIVSEYYYSAWGVRTLLAGADITDRGYTGHEHLTALNLINMNGRVYDPVLARFLSPDPYVQAPDFTQSFNRYSYCLNNPFKYNDESGEFWHIIIGAAIGGVVNLVTNLDRIDNFWQGLAYFSAGAAVGAGSAALGGLTAGWFSAAGIIPGAAVGAAGGAVTGAATGALSNVTLNGFNNVIGGQNFWNNAGESAISGLVSGAISGGIGGAIGGGIKGYQYAKERGANPWTLEVKGSERSYSAPVKVSSTQPNPERECYAYSIEYADKGHGNITASKVLNANANKAGEDIAVAARNAGFGNVHAAGSLSGTEWEQLGQQLQRGRTEIMATISQAEMVANTGHTVNVTQVRIVDKLNLFRGGTHAAFNGANIWNPIGGVIRTQNSFLKIIWINF